MWNTGTNPHFTTSPINRPWSILINSAKKTSSELNRNFFFFFFTCAYAVCFVYTLISQCPSRGSRSSRLEFLSETPWSDLNLVCCCGNNQGCSPGGCLFPPLYTFSAVVPFSPPFQCASRLLGLCHPSPSVHLGHHWLNVGNRSVPRILLPLG